MYRSVAAFLVLIALVSGADARSRFRHFGYRYPIYQSQQGNIFGPGHVGVAPSTAIPEGRSVIVSPASRNAGTGGVND